MPKQTAVRIPFNVVLSSDERDMLLALSGKNGTSAAQEIRQAIRARFNHSLKHIPTCANGTACFVPQMHVPVAGPNSGWINGEPRQ